MPSKDLTGPMVADAGSASDFPTLLANLEALCKFACEMVKVDHSGFVRFGKALDRGEVVAQFPSAGFEGLLGREVQLNGVAAEQRLLHQEDAIEITDLDDPEQRKALGSVADLLDEFRIKSLYIVKVHVRGEVIGSFSLDRVGKAARFNEDEKRLCRSLAGLASLIVEGSFLSHWLDVFQEATEAIISQQEAGPLLDVIVKQAVQLLEVEEAGIYERRYDEAGEYLLLSAASDPGAEKKFRREDGGMAWRLIDGDMPYLTTPDYSKSPNQARQFKGANRFGSVLEVPMEWSGERVGAIYVAAEKGREFTDFHANRLQRIADIATLAIQRSLLLTRIEMLSNASLNFSWRLDSKESLNERLKTIARYATEILDAEMCGILRVRDSEIMTLEASFGHKEPGGFPIGKPFRIVDGENTGLTGALAHRLREALARSAGGPFRDAINKNGEELREDPAYKGESDNSPSGQCNSLLAIPLLSIPPAPPAITGLLRVSNKRGVGGASKPGIRFNKEDEWILRVFAEAAAVAIETAELFSDREAQFSLYRTFSEALTGGEELDFRLDDIARQVAIVLKKSFCRILFCEDGSPDIWRVRGAATHPRERAQISWTPGKGSAVEVSKCARLGPVREGEAKWLSYGSGATDAAHLSALSEALRLGPQENGFKGELKSLVAFPLFVGTRVVGALECGELRDPSRGRGRFSPEEIALAAHPALLTAELLKRDLLRKREVESQAAFDSSLSRIRQIEDVAGLFLGIVREACSLFACTSAGMIRQSFPDGPIKIADARGPYCCLNKNDRALVAAFEELFSPDAKAIAPRLQELLSRLGLRSAAAAGDSLLASRLQYGNQSRCVLFVAREGARFFQSSAEQELLDKFARQCSMSLTRTVARERLERIRDAVNQLGETMAYGDPADALQNTLNGIMHATRCDSVVLYKIDSRSGEFLAPSFVGDVSPRNIVPVSASLWETAVGKILAKGELHAAPDAASDSIMHDAFQESEGVSSSAGLPIWVKHRAGDGLSPETPAAQERINVGVLFLNYKRPQAFGDDETRIISLFAPFVAVAIRNQEFYEQEHKKANIQRALSDAAKSLTQSLDFGDTTLQIAENAYEVAKAAGREVNFVVLKLFRGDRAYVVSAHPREEMERIRRELNAENMEVPLRNEDGSPKGIVGRAARTKQTQLVNNARADKDYIEVHAETKSQFVALLPPAEAPLGLISIESPNLNTFYQEDKETFELFAALASDAIRNAQQYGDLAEARLREEATAAVAIADIWAGILSHELSDEVEDVIRAAMTVEKEIRGGDGRSDGGPALNVLVERARDLRDLFPSQKIDYESFPLIVLDEHLAQWARERRPKLLGEGIALTYNDALRSRLRVRVHPKLLDRVLDLFLKNAEAAMKASDTKRLTLETADCGEGRVDILFSNTGPAVENTTWQHLGLKLIESRQGQGRGVLIACQIIKLFKGEFLKLRNADGEVTVGMRLPAISEVPSGPEP